MTRVSRLLLSLLLLAPGLIGAQVLLASEAFAISCPTGFTQVGTSTACERAFSVTGTQTWTVPSGVSSIDVLVVGGGGDGDMNNARNGGRGGGGGGIAVFTGYSVSYGDSFSVTVGANHSASSFSQGGSFLASCDGGHNGNSSGAGGAGQLATGTSGSTYAGSSGSSYATTSPAGTLVNAGLFQYAGTSPISPAVWGAGGGAGGYGDPGPAGSTGGNAYSPNSGGGGGGGGGSNLYTNAGRTGESGIVIVRTAGLTVPGTPTTSVNAGNQQLQVTFSVTNGGSPITQIQYSTNSGAVWSNAAATTSPLTITGLTNGVSYGVQIRAVNAQGTGAASATVSATPLGPALTPVLDTPIRTAGGFTVNVTNYNSAYSWTASISGGASVSIGSASSGVLPLTVTGMTAGSSATVTATSTRTGYTTGSATATGQAKSAQTVTWSPSVSLLMPATTVTPSNASALGGASISYALISAGTTGCTVDAGTGALTYLSIGSGSNGCVIRATSAATASYLSASTDVTFSVSKSNQIVSWSPATSVLTTQSPYSPTTSPVAYGGAPVSFAMISHTSATCEVNPTTGQLTYTGSGNCVVEADAATTNDYLAGSTQVTFTISKATPTLAWTPVTSFTVPDASTTFTDATTSSDAPVTYTLGSNTAGCTLAGHVLSFTQQGACVVTAAVTATTANNAATAPVTFTIDVAPPPSGSPGPLTFSSGDFGTVHINGTSSLTVTVSNSGTAPVTPTSISVAGVGLAVSGGTCAAGIPLPASGTCAVILDWIHTADTVLNGASLTIDYVGGVNPGDAVAITGNSLLAISPDRVALVTATLTLSTGNAQCQGGSVNAIAGAWLKLPTEESCVQVGANFGPSPRLLGWSTNANFPHALAKAQVACHWGVIDEIIDGWRMIFVPSGQSVFISGENTLFPIWDN